MSRLLARERLSLLISTVFAAILVASLAAGYRAAGCSLELWSSQEKSALLQRFASSYTDCRVTVDEVASGIAEQSLAAGSAAPGARSMPDVWTPAASTWVELLGQRLASQPASFSLPGGAAPSLAHSPLVIAMPTRMAQALGWPANQLGWADLLRYEGDPNMWTEHGHPEWGTFKLGETDPTVSTSGIHAFIGLFSAAVESRDGTSLPVAMSEADITDPRVLDFVTKAQSRVVHFADTVRDLQRNLCSSASLTYVSAAAMEEQEVFSYNTKCPAVQLAAFYPLEGTLFADHPYVVLNAAWVDAAKREAATRFLAYLLAPARQHAFQAAGFRDGNVPYAVPGAAISERNGLLPTQPALTLAQPAPRVLERIEQAWPIVH